MLIYAKNDAKEEKEKTANVRFFFALVFEIFWQPKKSKAQTKSKFVLKIYGSHGDSSSPYETENRFFARRKQN